MTNLHGADLCDIMHTTFIINNYLFFFCFRLVKWWKSMDVVNTRTGKTSHGVIKQVDNIDIVVACSK